MVAGALLGLLACWVRRKLSTDDDLLAAAAGAVLLPFGAATHGRFVRRGRSFRVERFHGHPPPAGRADRVPRRV
jgi:hypothetical protein